MEITGEYGGDLHFRKDSGSGLAINELGRKQDGSVMMSSIAVRKLLAFDTDEIRSIEVIANSNLDVFNLQIWLVRDFAPPKV